MVNEQHATTPVGWVTCYPPDMTGLEWWVTSYPPYGVLVSFFEELKRRNVFRVGIAYLISAWVLLQVVDLVLENIQFNTGVR